MTTASGIFKSATLRLTLGYLAIIMGLSLVFSTILYHVSAQGIETGLQRQRGIILGLPRFDGLRNPGYLDTLVENQIKTEKRHLIANLGLINIAVIILGGAAAYRLSRQTLGPIERALEAQTRFAADASHELRTPLTAMKSEIEVALRGKSLSAPEAREVLTSSLEEIDKLDALAAGLLKLAQNQGRAELERVNLLAVVEEAAERLAKAASQRGIQINISIPPTIELEASRPNLVEMVVILIDNALKYSPEKSHVSLRATADINRVRLEVADQGVGIKTSQMPHIFDRFYRADGSRNKQDVAGYGLGLAIAREIITQHKGTITAQSKPGEGTTMIVRLPLTHSNDATTWFSRLLS